MVALWIADLDATTFYAPSVPPEQAQALATAAAEHEQALTPANPKQITAMLMEMRLSTQRRNESEAEATHSFKTLVDNLTDTPPDIIREACRLYIRRERFFPRSPAEFLAYSLPLLNQRRRRALNLKRLADLAEEARAREIAMADAPTPTLDELRALARNPMMPRSILQTWLDRGWASPEDVETIRAELAQEAKTDPAD